MKIDNRYKGVLFACTAAFTYGLNSFFAKPLYARGMNVSSVLTYRYGIGIIIVALFAIYQRKCLKIPLKALPFTVINGFCMSMSSLTLYKAFEIMDVGIASTILFIYPTMIAAGMMLFFHEKPNAFSVIAIVLSLCGVAILNGSSSGGATVPAWGVILSILSALSYAVYVILVRQSPLKTVSAEAQTFYCLLFGIVVFLTQLKGGAELHGIHDATTVFLIAGIAIFPTVISLVATSRAVAYIGPTVTAILGAVEPLTAVFVGLFLFGEVFTWQLLVGIILILSSVMLVILAPARFKKRSR